jgi:hypothetical protein
MNGGEPVQSVQMYRLEQGHRRKLLAVNKLAEAWGSRKDKLVYKALFSWRCSHPIQPTGTNGTRQIDETGHALSDPGLRLYPGKVRASELANPLAFVHLGLCGTGICSPDAFHD